MYSFTYFTLYSCIKHDLKIIEIANIISGFRQNCINNSAFIKLDLGLNAGSVIKTQDNVVTLHLQVLMIVRVRVDQNLRQLTTYKTLTCKFI